MPKAIEGFVGVTAIETMADVVLVAEHETTLGELIAVLTSDTVAFEFHGAVGAKITPKQAL